MRRKNVIWGLLIIAVGVIFGLKAFGLLDVEIFFDGWWTLFIIVPCVIGLFTDSDKIGSIIGILVGVILLLACQGLFSFELLWKLAVPAIIILIGIKMIFKGTFHNDSAKRIKEITGDGIPLKKCCATFTGQNVDFTNEVFDGAEFTAVFGGIKCDLRNAVIEKDTVINVCCIFGGVEIFAPDNVNVKVCSNSVLGGIDDKHKKSTENAVTLYINGTCIFGGVEIK